MSNFWNVPSTLSVKQQHRWLVTFGDVVISGGKLSNYKTDGSIVPPHFIKSVEKPSYDIGTIEAKYLYSHKFNFNKRLVWNPITITINDIYDPSDKIRVSNGVTDDFNTGETGKKTTESIIYNILEIYMIITTIIQSRNSFI
mgnify:CR=1 FL=1